MTAERSEIIRKVADIVDFQPERFDMDWFEQDGDCGTKACIAGHIGYLTGDMFGERNSFAGWYDRQAETIGLDPWAGDFLFAGDKMVNMENGTISQILRKLSKEVETLDENEVLDENDIARIADEVIAEEAAVAA